MTELYHDSRRWASVLAAVALFAMIATGCTRAHAKTIPEVPDAPLDVPAPPPRDIEPADVEPPPPPAPAPETPRTTPPAPRPRATPPREQPKPDAPKVDQPAEPPKPAEEAPRPSTTLQTAPTTAEGELERSIRATLTRASNELNHVDYRGLNTDARAQYDSAKRFIRQAEDAVKAKNLLFAKNIADKAATISAQLRTR